MPDPRPISYDPTTGIAEIADANGVVRRVHRSGLTGDLSGLGMQVDSLAAPQQGMAQSGSFATPPRAAVPGDAAPISFGGESQASPDAMPFVATPQPVAQGAEPPIDFNRPPPAASPQASPAQGQPNAAGFLFRPEGASGGGNPYLDGTRPRFAQLPTSTRTQTSSQRTERGPLTGEAATLAQRVDDANTQQQNAAIGLASSQQEGLEAQAQLASNRAALQERQAADRQRRVNDREAERQRLMGQANELIDASKTDVEPSRLLGGAGNRILAALSIAFGAAGAAATGGENVGLKMITAAIDRDIEAQRENRVSKAEAAKGKLSALQLASQITDDEMTQRDIAHASMLEAASQMTASRIAQLGAQDVPENLTMLHGELEQEAVKLRASIAQSLGDQAVVNTTSRQVGGGVVDMARAYDESRGIEAFDRERFVSRGQGNAPTKQQAEELNKAGEFYGKAEDLLDKLIALRDLPEVRISGSAANARASALASRLTILFNSPAFANLGAIADTDKQILEAMAGDPTATFSRAGSRLEAMRSQLADEENITYRDRGVVRVSEVPEEFRLRQGRTVSQSAVRGESNAQRGRADFRAGY